MDTPAHPPLHLGAGHFHFTHRAPARLALKRGWFKEEGLTEVEITPTGRDGRTLEGLAAGRLQIGMDVRSDKVLHAFNQGTRLYIVGVWRNAFPFLLFGDRGMQGVGDLKGRRIGLHMGKDGIEYRHIRRALRAGGLNPDTDVEWVTLETSVSSLPDKIEALRSGKSQTACIQIHNASKLQSLGYPVLASFVELYPHGFPDRVIVATEGLLQGHPQTVKAYLKGIIRAYRFMRRRENFPEVERILTDLYEEDRAAGGVRAAEAQREPLHLLHTAEDFQHVPYPADAKPSLEGLRLVIEQEQEAGHLPSDFRAEAILRLEPVEAANREVNARFGPQGYE